MYLKTSLWERLKKNGYKKKNKEKRKKELRREKDKEDEYKEKRKWYGIKSIGNIRKG